MLLSRLNDDWGWGRSQRTGESGLIPIVIMEDVVCGMGIHPLLLCTYTQEVAMGFLLHSFLPSSSFCLSPSLLLSFLLFFLLSSFPLLSPIPASPYLSSPPPPSLPLLVFLHLLSLPLPPLPPLPIFSPAPLPPLLFPSLSLSSQALTPTLGSHGTMEILTETKL